MKPLPRLFPAAAAALAGCATFATSSAAGRTSPLAQRRDAVKGTPGERARRSSLLP